MYMEILSDAYIISIFIYVWVFNEMYHKFEICCICAKHKTRVRVEVIANDGWLGIKIKCPSGATCLQGDCCVRELLLIKSNKN